MQGLLALALLLTLPAPAILLGLLALVPAGLYPFAKRVTWWPQAVLGIAFNWGVLLAYAAHAGRVEAPAVLLWLAGIAWTLFYDTIYAHQDAEDDALIGVRSTARLFGASSRLWLRGFLVAAVLTMGAAVILAGLDGSPLALALALGAPWVLGWHLAWQLGRSIRRTGRVCCACSAPTAMRGWPWPSFWPSPRWSERPERPERPAARGLPPHRAGQNPVMLRWPAADPRTARLSGRPDPPPCLCPPAFLSLLPSSWPGAARVLQHAHW